MKVYLGLIPHSDLPDYYKVYNLGYLRESVWTAYYDYFAIEYDNSLYFDTEVQIVTVTGSIPKEQIIKII